MVYKRHIVNLFFILSFPVFGIGKYISGSISPSLGFIISAVPYFLILLFYVVDLIYRVEFRIHLNKNYWVMLAFLLSTVLSIYVSFRNKLPDLDFQFFILRSILLVIPFHAFLIVFLYNRSKDNLLKLTLTGLSLLLLLNIVGFYGFGLSNAVHHIEGRINFPFLEALYSGAGLIAIINIMLLYLLFRTWNYPVKFFFCAAYFITNLWFLFHINSRLVMIMFIFIIVIYLLKLSTRFTFLFLLSLFTLPILLNAGKLIYEVLSLPIFVSILQRVDLVDVTTFNGRSFLWENVFDWLLFDQRGILFGNGFQGHYFLDIQNNVAKLFGIRETYNLHLHSAALEILVNQGLVGGILMLVIYYKICRHYKKLYDQRQRDGAFYHVLVFMLFLMHVDMLQYMDNLGSIVLSLLVAGIVVRQHEPVILEQPAGIAVEKQNGQLKEMSWSSS